MHILSLSDIQLIIRLFEQHDVMSDAHGREQQVYHLIKLGYLRPLRGVYALTELGEKTARSLQMRQFVPSKAVDEMHALTDNSEPATVEAGSEVVAEATAETTEVAEQA
ncbi:MAG: hypothetical protein ACKO71_02605 [Betaproteobacteria bacterium]